VEHDRQENLSYKARTISYDDLTNACRGFVDHFMEREYRPTHYIVESLLERAEASSEDGSAAMKLFAQSQLSGRSRIEDSLRTLKELAEWFERIGSLEASFSPQVNDLVDLLNQIMNAKQVERYRMSAVFGEEHELTKQFMLLHNDWETIRKGVVRYMYLPKYQTDTIQAIADKLLELVRNETDFQNCLFDSFEQIQQKANA